VSDHQVQNNGLSLPNDLSLPMFVYGALKPGMPAFESIRSFVACKPEIDRVQASLYVRDGLPLIFLIGSGSVEGYVIHWSGDNQIDAYTRICHFEPRSQYVWQVIQTESGVQTNALIGRHTTKGNPQPVSGVRWSLKDDPAFGEGIRTVRLAFEEVTANTNWNQWEKFFRAQMAYLLLWSILERLSAFCFGPVLEPHKRINLLHSLEQMGMLISKHVHRQDSVTDSRQPNNKYKLDSTDAQNCFKYFYQVRCNLSHRGKAVINEVEKVTLSLAELLSITEEYLQSLDHLESSQ
jgi:hypothetical protein